jgi:hypothetical protein
MQYETESTLEVFALTALLIIFLGLLLFVVLSL